MAEKLDNLIVYTAQVWHFTCQNGLYWCFKVESVLYAHYKNQVAGMVANILGSNPRWKAGRETLDRRSINSESVLIETVDTVLLRSISRKRKTGSCFSGSRVRPVFTCHSLTNGPRARCCPCWADARRRTSNRSVERNEKTKTGSPIDLPKFGAGATSSISNSIQWMNDSPDTQTKKQRSIT